MERLETIVRDLEEADLPLETSLERFEEGVGLSRLLNRKLNEAEKKVEILLRDEDGTLTARPFEVEEGEEAGDDAEEAEEGSDAGTDIDQGGLPF